MLSESGLQSYILAAKGISGESRVAQITADVTVAGVVIVVFY